MTKQTALLLLALIAAPFVVGCSGGRSPEQAIADANKTNCHRLINLYVRFQTQNRWNGPKDEAEFKAYIADMEPTMLSRMGIEPGETEGLFTSQVDQAPFKIRYGVRGSARGSNEAVIFETEGAEGTYRIGFTSSKIEEVSDKARYDGLLDGSIREKLEVVGPPGGR